MLNMSPLLQSPSTILSITREKFFHFYQLHFNCSQNASMYTNRSRTCTTTHNFIVTTALTLISSFLISLHKQPSPTCIFFFLILANTSHPIRWVFFFNLIIFKEYHNYDRFLPQSIFVLLFFSTIMGSNPNQ